MGVLDWFNLYDLFVNQVFGTFWLANLGVGSILFIIGIISKQSLALIFAILMLYGAVLSLAIAPFLTIIFFVASFIYVGYEIYQYFNRSDTTGY